MGSYQAQHSRPSRRLTLCSWTVGKVVFHFVKPPYPSIPKQKTNSLAFRHASATSQGGVCFGLGGDHGIASGTRLIIERCNHPQFRRSLQTTCYDLLRHSNRARYGIGPTGPANRPE